jgi:hypothetical protein
VRRSLCVHVAARSTPCLVTYSTVQWCGWSEYTSTALYSWHAETVGLKRDSECELLLLQGNTTETKNEKDQNITATTATAAKSKTLLLPLLLLLLLLHYYLVPFLSACR